ALSGTAGGAVCPTKPPEGKAKQDGGRNEAEAGWWKRRCAEEGDGDCILKRGCAWAGRQGEGLRTEHDCGPDQAAGDVCHTEKRLCHRYKYEKGYKQTHTPIGHECAREHDREHRSAFSQFVGHEISNGRN